MLLVRRSIGNAKRVGQRCVEQLKNFEVKIKSHENTQARIDGRQGNALIASTNRHSRQTRPSGESICFGSYTLLWHSPWWAWHCAGTANTWEWWQLSRTRGDASAVRPPPAGSTSNPGSNCEVLFCRVLHTLFSHFRAHAFACSVTVARSSAVQVSSSRRLERKWAIVCGFPQSQSTDWASSW